ncbi:MAG TPA: CbtA family protein [Roseiarcus sp.]|nr:CbtA family protein [Roseiarcus sp.]
MRGMLVGLLAGILSFCFLKIYGEPMVDRAIAFETQWDAAKVKAAHDEAVAKGLPAPVEVAAPELVSRPVQAGIGLFTGVMVYNVAFGGLFALVYALAYGRMGAFGPRATAALIMLSGIVAVYVVPSLKYPANPPSVGDPATIVIRTKLYFAIIAISLAAMIGAWMLRNRLVRPLGEWNAALTAAAAYVVVVVAVALALPTVNEVPEAFPAVVLWQFRMASLGAQAIMWATLGLGFGALTERAQSLGRAVRLRTV